MTSPHQSRRCRKPLIKAPNSTPQLVLSFLQHSKPPQNNNSSMASDMTLLWGPGSPPCWRIMIALEEKGIKGYNSKELSFEKGEHKGPEVMKVNPRGQLPCFTHGDKIINESMGACEYLEDQFKGQGTALIPECPAEKAMMYQRMHESNALGTKTSFVLYYNYFVPEGERHDAAIKRNQEALTAELKIWEGYLSKCTGGYMAGKTFSLADVILFPSFAYCFRNGLCEKKFPNIAKYYNCLKERPSIKNSWPETWKKTPCPTTLKDI